MAEVIGALATLACSLFAGAAVYITFVEHPARLSCGTEIAARQWAPSYKRATVMQVPLAVLATRRHDCLACWRWSSVAHRGTVHRVGHPVHACCYSAHQQQGSRAWS